MDYYTKIIPSNKSDHHIWYQSSSILRPTLQPLRRIEFPRFNGENPRAWIDEANKYFQVIVIPEDKRVDLAGYIYFEGKAKLWFQSYVEMKETPGWNDFVGDVVDTFDLAGVNQTLNEKEFNEPQLFEKMPMKEFEKCKERGLNEPKVFDEMLEKENYIVIKKIDAMSVTWKLDETEVGSILLGYYAVKELEKSKVEKSNNFLSVQSNDFIRDAKCSNNTVTIIWKSKENEGQLYYIKSNDFLLCDYHDRIFVFAIDPGGNRVTLSLLNNEKIDATIGPQKSAQASFVIGLGDGAKVPTTSFYATSHSLHPQIPYFIQSTLNGATQVGATGIVVEHFLWTQVVLIYEESSYSNGIISYLQNAIQAANSRIYYKSVISLSTTNGFMLQEFYKMKSMQTRIFTVHLTSSLNSRLFPKVKEVGILSEGYSWILTSGVMDLLYLLDSHVVETLHGILGVKSLIPRSMQLSSTDKRWKKDFLNANLDILHAKLNLYGMWAYYTFWASAMAAERLRFREPSSLQNTSSPNSTNLFNTEISQILTLINEMWLNAITLFILTGTAPWVLEYRFNKAYRGTSLEHIGMSFFFPFMSLVFAHRGRMGLLGSYFSLTDIIKFTSQRITCLRRLSNEFLNMEQTNFRSKVLRTRDICRSKCRVASTNDGIYMFIEHGRNYGLIFIQERPTYLLTTFQQHYAGIYESVVNVIVYVVGIRRKKLHTKILHILFVVVQFQWMLVGDPRDYINEIWSLKIVMFGSVYKGNHDITYEELGEAYVKYPFLLLKYKRDECYYLNVKVKARIGEDQVAQLYDINIFKIIEKCSLKVCWPFGTFNIAKIHEMGKGASMEVSGEIFCSELKSKSRVWVYAIVKAGRLHTHDIPVIYPQVNHQESCHIDLVKDGGHLYFIRFLDSVEAYPGQRAMIVFVLAVIVDGNRRGHGACVEAGLIHVYLKHLQDSFLNEAQLEPLFLQWLCLCLGKLWEDLLEAQIIGFHVDAPAILEPLLSKPQPEVQVAAAFALDIVLDVGFDTLRDGLGDKDCDVDEKIRAEASIIKSLFNVVSDGSPMVRAEVIVI